MQENDDIHPDYRLLMEQLTEVGATVKRVWDGICEGVGHAVNTIRGALTGLYTKPRRSKLRLKCHRTQYEKRIAWKAAHMQRIYAKEAKIYLRRVGVL